MSYHLEFVGSPESPDFDAAYGALAAEFLSRGELERREVLAAWLRANAADAAERVDTEQALHRYHLIVARDDQRALAGVRDCHLVLDLSTGVLVVYLAHVLVLPPYRRSGLGKRLREEPLRLAEQLLQELGVPRCDVLLAAEMEPIDASDVDSIVRLVAYGRAGFKAVDPRSFPYWQPDFRNADDASTRPPSPVPLLAVVHWVGNEGRPRLPKRLARAFVTHLYRVFSSHVPPDELSALQHRTLKVLDATATSDVTLVQLPESLADEAAIAQLSRSRVLSGFPKDVDV